MVNFVMSAGMGKDMSLRLVDYKGLIAYVEVACQLIL
jgi:hypothetical protein